MATKFTYKTEVGRKWDVGSGKQSLKKKKKSFRHPLLVVGSVSGESDLWKQALKGEKFVVEREE